MRRVAQALKGAATFVPGAFEAFSKRRSGGDSALYCYGVWLKHLTLLWAAGEQMGEQALPRVVVELGPGYSLGVGLAAVLSGVEAYYALDVMKLSPPERTLAVLDDLLPLFEARAPRPRKGWPDFDAHLDASLFPSHILTEQRLRESLAPERLARIRRAILGEVQEDPPTIHYAAPWSDPDVVPARSADLVLSHNVLEYVEDPAALHRMCHAWLRPGGWASHQVDLSSHDMTDEWNGHWTYPKWLWALVVGKRPYFLTRFPCSSHRRFLEEASFEIVRHEDEICDDGLPRKRMARMWRELSDHDLVCSGTFVQARRPNGPAILHS